LGWKTQLKEVIIYNFCIRILFKIIIFAFVNNLINKCMSFFRVLLVNRMQ